ncbi:hypothetical protein [Phytohabitans kaempferiae]|uniref:Uncharacterized protein n=1 Tax=Phytohabitans kaempferiae TaxID=1620943 RepID=A0ABV6M9I0_9ACTN
MTPRRSVKVRRSARGSHGPGDNALHIYGAALRIAFWPDVEVTKRNSSSLTKLELFVLECVTELETFSTAQFEAITGLPSELLHALCRRLIRAGAVVRRDTEYFATSTARQTLKVGRTYGAVEGSQSYIYFVDSGEVVALSKQDAKAFLRLDERGRYIVATVPAPRELAGVKRSDLLEEHIRLGRIRGVDSGVLGLTERVTTPDPPLFADGTCLAYQCDAVLRTTYESTELSLMFRSKPPRRSNDQARSEPVHILIQGQTNLGDSWKQLADVLGTTTYRRALWHALTSSTSAPPRVLPTRCSMNTWQLDIDGLSASEVATQQNLASEAALEVVADDCTVSLSMSFRPTDPRAERLFARDKAIAKAQAEDSVNPILRFLDEGRPQQPHVPQLTTIDDILSRAWSLGHFTLAYALTEPTDIPRD